MTGPDAKHIQQLKEGNRPEGQKSNSSETILHPSFSTSSIVCECSDSWRCNGPSVCNQRTNCADRLRLIVVAYRIGLQSHELIIAALLSPSLRPKQRSPLFFVVVDLLYTQNGSLG